MVVFALAVAALLGIAQAGALQSLSVNFSSVIRSDFIGLSAVRHGFDYFEEEISRGMNTTFRNLGYDRMAQARISSVRTWCASEWAMPGGWGMSLDFSAPRFEQFAAWVADMKALGISVTINSGWWFTQNSCSPGPPSNCTPTATSLKVFTFWISSLVRELVQTRGLTNVDTLLLFTEPLSYNSGNVPAGFTQETYYSTVVRALHEHMVADGTRHLVKFLGPNDGGLASPAVVAALKYTVTTLDDIIDIYSSHDYNQASYSAWKAMFETGTAVTGSTGKPFYVDEGGAGPESVRNATDYGTYLSLWQAAAMNAGASGTFLWLLADQYYVWPLEHETNGDSFVDGLHRWGLSFWLPDSTSVRPAYYAYTIMTRFLRPPQGAATACTCRVTGELPDGVIGAAVAGCADTGRADYRALLLINEGSSAVNVSVALVGSTSKPLQRYGYDPAHPPADAGMVQPSGTLAGGAGVLSDTLQPREMVVWASSWEN